MAHITIIDRKTALRSQRATTAGDVHLCITDTESTNPHRAWWITADALQVAQDEGFTLDTLDRLVRTAPRIRPYSLEYPLRASYLPLLRENLARRERGEPDDALWRWRTFHPTPRTFVQGICRWDALQQRWIGIDQRPLW